jgi:UDP:flavonoid glycosyltransferase YjiC (YdhE family)
VKVLCTCVPTKGHFYPMVPLARAVADAGHEVVFAAAEEFQSELTAAGFTAVPAGLGLSALREAISRDVEASRDLPEDQKAALMFTRLAPRALRDSLIPFARQWKPDVVLHEETEYGGALVAALLGVPNVVVGWPSPVRSPFILKRLHRELAGFWSESGMAPVAIGGLYRYLFLDLCPPSLQGQHVSQLGHSWPVQPILYNGPRESVPPSLLDRLSGRPTVYVTLGTVPAFNEAPHIFTAVVEGLSAEDLNVIMTVGENNDPAVMGLRSEHVHVEQYIPQALLLPHCDVVMNHGGGGSFIGALWHGLPVLITPRGGAAQYRNAFACEKAGAGRMLLEKEISAETVRQHVRALLDEPGYRTAARRIAREIDAMPGPAKAVEVVERLVACATRR